MNVDIHVCEHFPMAVQISVVVVAGGCYGLALAMQLHGGQFQTCS